MFATRRVVVTGVGSISPLGHTFHDSWKALLNYECGVTTLEEALRQQYYNQTEGSDQLHRELELGRTLPCQVAAPIQGLQIRDARTPRFVELALIAGNEAFQSARLDEWLSLTDEITIRDRSERIGVCVGTGMSSVREVAETARTFQERGLRRVSPHFVPKVLSNSAAGRLSLEFGLCGPNHCASTACAAGSHAIGDAMRCIQFDNADIMLAGGAESCIDPLSMAGFCRLRALSTSLPPLESSRPFDKQRNGFVMGEGSAILVLEEMNHALERGAPILAELTGFGLTGDAFHITAPDETGRGAKRSMRMAMAQAQSDGSDVGYVNAHATSTPKGDEIEAQVIHDVLGERDNQDSTKRSSPLHVSSTKGASGHLLGAAGALEAAFTVQSLVDQLVPPTLNLQEMVGEDKLGFTCNSQTEEKGDMQAAMSNSFGFGGTNASLFFKKYDSNTE